MQYIIKIFFYKRHILNCIYYLKYLIINKLPIPTSDSTSIYPLLLSIIDLAKANPIPLLSFDEFFIKPFKYMR